MSIRPITESELQVANQRREEMLYVVPRGVTIEDLLRPEFWGTVRKTLTRFPWTKVECVADDGSFECVLRVMSSSEGMVRMRLVSSWLSEEAVTQSIKLPDGCVVEHIAGQGWRGVFNGDVVVSRQGTEAEAIMAVVAHAARAGVAMTEEAPPPASAAAKADAKAKKNAA